MSTTSTRRQGRGWIAFAALILIVAGVMDILNALWALDAQDTAVDALFWDNNLEAWGWFYLVVGIVLVVTGAFIFRRAPWAGAVGIAVGCIGAILNIFWIFTFPLASILLVTLNLIVVYALTTYGMDELEY
ncbi:MAG: DUF7144 family membrane protein [Gaiellaceae bacterium]